MIEELDTNDIPEIFPLLRKFNQEGGLEIQEDTETATRNLETFLNSGIGKVFIARRDGEIVGALGGLVFPDYLGPQTKAQELFWYVDKKHRSGSLAIKLMKAYEKWAKSKGADRIVMTCLKKLQGDRIGKIYEKLGYRELETNYEKLAWQ